MPEKDQPQPTEQQDEAPLDSPTGWVAAHIRRYDRSGGKEGPGGLGPATWWTLRTTLSAKSSRISYDPSVPSGPIARSRYAVRLPEPAPATTTRAPG